MPKRSAKPFFCALFLSFALALMSVASAQADFGLNGFDVTFEEQGGAPATKAGSHPYAAETIFNVNFHEEGGEASPDEELKDLEIELPLGLAGNPTATPRCTHGDFLNINPVTEASFCADDTAIGTVNPQVVNPGFGSTRPLYNLVPPPGVAAEIGFVAVTVPVTIDFKLTKTPPYRLLALSPNLPQPIKVYGAKLKVWGNPANPAHDGERGLCVYFPGTECDAEGAPEKPFITLPRACSPPLFADYLIRSWQNPSVTLPPGASQTPLEVSECEALEFDPEAEATPTASQADAPSGLDFGLQVKDEGLSEPQGTAKADIEKIITTLPVGMTVNPSAGEGQAACSKAQYEAETLAPASGCPEASKVGEVEVQTPLLEGETLEGPVYLASQDNEFGSLLALYIMIKDPKLGVLVKQPAKVELDPETGQITTTVSGFPQLPVSHVHLHVRSGPRAPLVAPPNCGKYNIQTTLTPYNGDPPITDTSSFEVSSGIDGGPCPSGGPLPFKPSFSAGTLNNSASTYSPFNMRLTRQDGEAEISKLSAILPAGVVPKLAGLAKCSPAQIEAAKKSSGRQELAQPSCPAASQIGQIQAGAGVGQDLTYVPGKLYLAGPFGGDPLSAVAIVPAVAGPVDLGTVATQVGLTLNPATHLGEIDSSHSEPLPRILAGIPLRLRDLQIFANRPNFTLNATGCEPEQTTASLSAFSLPTPAALSDRYQAQNCGSLKFGPKLSLKLTGATKRTGHPKLFSEVTYPYPSGPGYSNIGKAIVTLPPSEFIDQNHINNPCTRVQFAANQCPPSSILGSAKATSPLLDEPLEGPVYFRSNGGERKLPDIVADLHGLVDIELVGHVDSQVRGEVSRIRTTFEGVPDAPVSKFTLQLNGGKKKGLLVNSRNLCASPQKAKLSLTGQNGALRESQPLIKTSCKGKGKKHKKH